MTRIFNKGAEMDPAFDDDFDDEDDEFNLGIDCSMGQDGLCDKAGSEECDECPYMND
jgi:hypothetical protein